MQVEYSVARNGFAIIRFGQFLYRQVTQSWCGWVFVAMFLHLAVPTVGFESLSAQEPGSAVEKIRKPKLGQVEEDNNPLARFTQSQRRQLETVVDNAFGVSHDGFSVDEVLLDDKLRTKFLDACAESQPTASEFELCWALLNFRKAGKLSTKSTKRRSATGLDKLLPLAEASARSILDQYNVSTDKMIANPKLLRQFDLLILDLNPRASLYDYRKAVFRLRKTRKLKPELIVRVADWSKVVTRKRANEIAADFDLAPENPGVYLFFDKSGYLYIGEATNLRDRLKQHLDESDRQSLAMYFKQNKYSEIQIEIHAFDPKSDGKKVSARRAYESELIRTRNPRFNIRP